MNFNHEMHEILRKEYFNFMSDYEICETLEGFIRTQARIKLLKKLFVKTCEQWLLGLAPYYREEIMERLKAHKDLSPLDRPSYVKHNLTLPDLLNKADITLSRGDMEDLLWDLEEEYKERIKTL